MERVSIVIAEHGGNWAPWARKLRADKERVVVLVQADDETPQAFSQRVITRLRRLRKEGAVLQEAAMVGGPACTSAHKHQRTKILRKLTAQLSLSGNESQLFLDPAAAEHEPSYNLMRALAWALADMAKGSGLSISVQALGMLPPGAAMNHS